MPLYVRKGSLYVDWVEDLEMGGWSWIIQVGSKWNHSVLRNWRPREIWNRQQKRHWGTRQLPEGCSQWMQLTAPRSCKKWILPESIKGSEAPCPIPWFGTSESDFGIPAPELWENTFPLCAVICYSSHRQRIQLLIWIYTRGEWKEGFSFNIKDTGKDKGKVIS